ncbi:MAG TPA: hypothetical protein VGG46_03995 [Terriglobales bacterium]|jgi:hypothetical protein
MAKLTSKSRNAFADRVFGLPKQRAYPMPDKKHARLAKSGASRAERIGNITRTQEAQIDRKANRKLRGR